ncbi:MAG: helix-turn-helix transcriptional regulator [Planctomycetes bacterium]|nr:helix-turn-helix transcriptional regulator [Planctomycetota bacterium]
MGTPTLQTLGQKLLKKRAGRGIREVAKEIGISHATLSRVERGFLPDLETFGKICKWLGVDPGEVLRIKVPGTEGMPTVAVHFRKESSLSPKTAQALATLILAAQRALAATQGARE